jgi:dicarboxylate/amino acid:cation (Na+ or H+) symporter, DAACS family
MNGRIKTVSEKKSDGNLRIVYGLAAGVVVGALMSSFLDSDTALWIVNNVTQPVGTLFLRGLFMVVVPLVVSSLAAGVSDLGSIQNLGHYGKKAAVYYLATTLLAVLIGQALVSTLKPGAGVDQTFIAHAADSFKDQTSKLQSSSEAVGKSLWPGLVETVVPKNILEEWSKTNMLSVIFVAIVFGAALLRIESRYAKPMTDVLHAISQAAIMTVGWVMKFAPLAVGCLMVNAIMAFNIEILRNVAFYFFVVVLGYGIHFFGSYGLLAKYLLNVRPHVFFKEMMPVFLTAFSTSSSNATLPTTIAHLKNRFGVPEKVVTFTAPLGATVNMDGTALFEMVAAVFIAQVFGIELSALQQVTLVLLVVITSVGVAGIPGGSIPLLMSAMASVGIPPEGIALILGVDRLLDMGRTVLNVTGDAICALYLAKDDGLNIEDELRARA